MNFPTRHQRNQSNSQGILPRITLMARMVGDVPAFIRVICAIRGRGFLRLLRFNGGLFAEQIPNVGASLVDACADPSRPTAGRASSSDAPTITVKENFIHDAALVATLRQLHDDLDADGWP
jgi:hypothetical protein